jgi:glucose-6-phosphate isomerase
VRKLRELDIFKGPIHCNDLKRESVYVKDNDKWEKENDDKPKLLSAIQSVSNKNIKQLNQWREENPDCVEPTSSKNDDYLSMFKHSMGGATEEEEDSNIQKVMKNRGRPALQLQLDSLTEESIGAFFFALSVLTAYAGRLLGVDPFDQPGVEEGKVYIRETLEQIKKQAKNADPEDTVHRLRLHRE